MREHLHMYDQGCTISNLANTRVDSLHTSDLSPQTQFHILFAIKVPFFFFFFCYFGLPWLSMCLIKLKKKGTPENHIIHMNMSQSTQWCATVPFSSQWGKPCTVTSTLHRLHWPLGGRGPLLWAPPRAVREEGEGGKKLMPWFQMSGLVNMPRTVVKDGNENGRLPGCTAQWIHFPICIYGGGREGKGKGSQGGVLVATVEVNIFDFTSSSTSL